MNKAELSEIKAKEARVLSLLDRHDCDALLIGREDNFEWFTCGGSSEVVRSSEYGFAVLIISRDGTQLIAHVMDGQRIVDEEMNGYEVTYVPLRWYDPPPIEKAMQLINGMRVISDIPGDGVTFDPRAIQAMHYPLSEAEIRRLRELGAVSDRILHSVAEAIKPGMTELDIAGMLLGEYGSLGIRHDVLLIGSDERVARYRHPVPTEKKVQKHVLLHTAVRGWGLHANVTRLLYFGSVPAEIERKYHAACTIQAASIALCTPGRRFQEILETQKQIYEESGYGDEWRNHFQGAITGYILADPTLCLDPDARISTHQAYDWFVTITGVKVEELSVNTGDSREVCSAAGHWPTARYSHGDQAFDLPRILIR